MAGPIRDVIVDTNGIHKWDESNGDTWDPFWAGDDRMYSFACDGRGFFPSGSRNMTFNLLEGVSASSLAGHPVNSMNEYGNAIQREADGATWKANGQECIDGVFYAFVSRDAYGNESGDPLLRQTAFNSSLIKSTDLGETWTRDAAANYANPMWPGRGFGAPFFIHYGKNGGQSAHDAADSYVYATSTNGFWNDGDYYVLGRAPREKLSDLNPLHWSYYIGGDGIDSASWSPDLCSSAPILSLPEQCGSGPVCYVEALRCYIMVAWYNPETLLKWFDPREMRYDFYQAMHPWGPWDFISSFSDRVIQGGFMYGPSICARFQEKPGCDVHAAMFTSGEPFDDVPAGIYKMWMIPLVLRTTPALSTTLINDTDPSIVYTGEWIHSSSRAFYDHDDDVHGSLEPGAAAEIAFEGVGINYIAEKDRSHGLVDVFLDDVFQQTVDLGLTNFPRLSRVNVFGIHDLASGNHKLRIVNRGAAWAVIDAFEIVRKAS